jgi:hypothetical protein
LIAAPGMAGLKLCRSWTCHGEMIVESTTADSTEESRLTACSSSAHLSGQRPRSVDTTRGRYQSEHSDCQHQVLSHRKVCVRRLWSMATLIYQLHVTGTAWVENVWVYLHLLYTSQQTIVAAPGKYLGRFAKKSKNAPMYRSLATEQWIQKLQ